MFADFDSDDIIENNGETKAFALFLHQDDGVEEDEE